jgi:hypothetical protein
MQLKVVRLDGLLERINIQTPAVIKEGKIEGSNGVEYFFTKDGTYDGWGKPVNDISEDAAISEINTIENNRSIILPSNEN